MQTKTTFKLIGTALLSLVLTACGGGKGSALDNTLNGASSVSSTSSSSLSSAFGGDSSANSSASSIDTTSLSNIGFGSGGTFQPGKIGVGIGSGTLSPGGVTALTVNLVSITGTLVTQPVTVVFNSKCFAAQKALLGATTVESSSGEATTTYTANGCVGDDLITATVSYDEKVLTAQTTINVEQDTVGSVRFSDASPPQINLKGTGGTETSVVRFQVFGSTGAPIENIDVEFALSTTTGGLVLVNTTGKTNSAGYVSTTVQAGTVATSVRITAKTATGLSTQSNVLVVSTGIPDQNSMSLSLSDLAPISWNVDGVESVATIRMADAFNNLVPDGTAVSFTTSGGAIESSCITKDGSCSVKWKSQEPRPTIPDFDEFFVGPDLKVHCPNSLAECRSGRVKILATSIGNESFVDKNANGLYNGPLVDGFASSTTSKCYPNIPLSTAKIGAINGCDDLGEAYLDKNFNKQRDDDEEFVDFNVDGSFNSGDGIYNGVLCNNEESECNKASVSVRGDATLVMSSGYVYRDSSGLLPGQPSTEVSIGAGNSKSINMFLGDINGNGLPMGTTITVKTDTASNVTASVSPSFALGMSQEPTVMTLFLKAGDDVTKKPSGSVIVEIKAPTGLGNVTTALSVSVCGPDTLEVRDGNNQVTAPATTSNCD
ncbi:MAG: hypothetical protein EOO52_04040 [Gammaproteobacteria bacterium]|nr:MAG: hypothetical protein EOO52_04040 [Gammaproteobacteria bacterium]